MTPRLPSLSSTCLKQEKVLSASVLPKFSGVASCVHLQLKLLTEHHSITANNFLVHLILWHVTWRQYWYSTHYKLAALPQHLTTVL